MIEQRGIVLHLVGDGGEAVGAEHPALETNVGGLTEHLGGSLIVVRAEENGRLSVGNLGQLRGVVRVAFLVAFSGDNFHAQFFRLLDKRLV